MFDGLTTWVEKCIDAATTYINSYLSNEVDSDSLKVDYDHLRECIDDVGDGIKTVGSVLINASIHEIKYNDDATIKKVEHDIGVYKLDDTTRKRYRICYDRRAAGKVDAAMIDAIQTKLAIALAFAVGIVHKDYTDTNGEELYCALVEVMNLMFFLDRLYGESYCLYVQIPYADSNDLTFAYKTSIGE